MSSKKSKKAKVESQEVTNQGAEENTMELTSADIQEVIPNTIVEGSVEEVFAGQMEGQEVEVTSVGEAVEGQVVEAKDDSQPVEQTSQPGPAETQPEEKPAEKKPRISKRLYIPFIEECLEMGKFARAELLEEVLKKFPEVKKSGVQTFMTDLFNEKYCHFKPRKVGKTPDGKVIFLDKLVPGFIVAEGHEQAMAEPKPITEPLAEVAPVEAEQPEQATE